MLRKATLAAIAAFTLALPGTAGAATFLHEGNEFDGEVPYSGTLIFPSKDWTVECPIKLIFTVKGKAVTVTKMEITAACTTKGSLAKCTVSQYTPETLPWKVDVHGMADQVTVNDMTLSLFFTGKDCRYASLHTNTDPLVITSKGKGKGSKFSGKSQTKLTPKKLGYPVDVEGTEITTEGNALTAFGMSGRCPGSTYNGELEEASSTITLTPEFDNTECTVGEGEEAFDATVSPNGCSFVLHVAEGSEDEWSAVADLMCPEGGKLVIDVYLGSAHGFKICTLRLGEQSGLEGLTLTNDTESGHVVVEGAATGVTVEKTGLCGAGTTEEGAYDLNVTGIGTDPEEGLQGILVKEGMFATEEVEETEAEDSGEGSFDEETYEIG